VGKRREIGINKRAPSGALLISLSDGASLIRPTKALAEAITQDIPCYSKAATEHSQHRFGTKDEPDDYAKDFVL
jgi:hypothetical protein